MRRKIMLVLIAVTCMLSACDTTDLQTEIDSNNKYEHYSSVYSDVSTIVGVSEWVDPQTGVTYWITSGGGICPRYEDDGELMIQKD